MASISFCVLARETSPTTTQKMYSFLGCFFIPSSTLATRSSVFTSPPFAFFICAPCPGGHSKAEGRVLRVEWLMPKKEGYLPMRAKGRRTVFCPTPSHLRKFGVEGGG